MSPFSFYAWRLASAWRARASSLALKRFGCALCPYLLCSPLSQFMMFNAFSASPQSVEARLQVQDHVVVA